MELNREARRHWLDVFARVLDEGKDDEVVQITLRMETFLERCDERAETEDGTCADDDQPFDWGEGY